MQNAERYRRGIVLPLDAAAEECLRRNNVHSDTNARYLRIDGNLFEELWRLGLFQEINARCGSLLDDYEEAIIEPDVMGDLTDALTCMEAKEDAKQPSVFEHLRGLRAMANEARDLSLPLLFIL
jgi:hypothetical protein